MSKLRPVSFSELVRKLKSLDFEGPFIGVDLLKRILRQGGIQKDEWNRA